MGRTRMTAGVTLFELLLVVGMAGVVLLMAMPSIAQFRQRMQLDAAAYQLLGDLQLAQIEAIKRNRSMQVTVLSPTHYHVDSIGERTLADGVELLEVPAAVRFAPFGPPVSGPATFSLKLGPREKRVVVNPSGLARVQ
jgi:type IV fimbrial biogenesis protein FimT